MNSNELKDLKEILQRRDDKINSVWINTKSIFFTLLTVIVLLTSVLLLPLVVILIGGAIAFVFYKLKFTIPKD